MILKNKVEELLLSESYSFNVVIKQNGMAFAAKLNLSPEAIIFTVTADEHGGRTFNHLEHRLDELVCEGRNQAFILRDLQLLSMSNRAITDDHSIWFIEAFFKVSYVIFCSNNYSNELLFDGIQLHSKSIGWWVGITHKQQKIMSNYEEGNPDLFEDSYEFVVEISELDAVAVKYNIVIGSSLHDFNNGISFAPTFNYISEGLTAEKTLATYHKLNDFLTFALGYTPNLDKITLHCSECRNSSIYVTTSTQNIEKRPESVLFPLGMNINNRLYHSEFPPIPTSAFVNYFAEKSILPNLVHKYITYRNMGNIEDNFLGYFRLLEKQSFKQKNYLSDDIVASLLRLSRKFLRVCGVAKSEIKSFDGALKRANGSKYNTEKCLTDFYLSLPENIRQDVKLESASISDVCKFRNDITHANQHMASEREAFQYTKFVESLLVLSILRDLGADLESTTEITKRIR